MKKFTIPNCEFDGKPHPFDVYVDQPCALVHPLYYQQLWLREERGGEIPSEMIDSFRKLYDIAVEHNVNYADLCMYALGQENKKIKKDKNVVYVNFAEAIKKANDNESGDVLISNLLPAEIDFFGVIPLNAAQIEPFCKLLSKRMLMRGSFKSSHSKQFAEAFLEAVLEIVCSLFDIANTPQTCAEKLSAYFAKKGDISSYNLSVVADTMGYALSFRALATIEFYLRAGIDWQEFLQEEISRSVYDWAAKSEAEVEASHLRKFGAEKKALLTLKKSLKTTFSQV